MRRIWGRPFRWWRPPPEPIEPGPPEPDDLIEISVRDRLYADEVRGEGVLFAPAEVRALIRQIDRLRES